MGGGGDSRSVGSGAGSLSLSLSLTHEANDRGAWVSGTSPAPPRRERA